MVLCCISTGTSLLFDILQGTFAASGLILLGHVAVTRVDGWSGMMTWLDIAGRSGIMISLFCTHTLCDIDLAADSVYFRFLNRCAIKNQARKSRLLCSHGCLGVYSENWLDSSTVVVDLHRRPHLIRMVACALHNDYSVFVGVWLQSVTRALPCGRGCCGHRRLSQRRSACKGSHHGHAC